MPSTSTTPADSYFGIWFHVEGLGTEDERREQFMLAWEASDTATIVMDPMCPTRRTPT